MASIDLSTAYIDTTATTTKEDVAVLKVTTAGMQEDIKEIKENQKVILEFITEQKAGRKIVWLIFGAMAGLVALTKDVGTILSNFFHR